MSEYVNDLMKFLCILNNLETKDDEIIKIEKNVISNIASSLNINNGNYSNASEEKYIILIENKYEINKLEDLLDINQDTLKSAPRYLSSSAVFSKKDGKVYYILCERDLICGNVDGWIRGYMFNHFINLVNENTAKSYGIRLKN